MELLQFLKQKLEHIEMTKGIMKKQKLPIQIARDKANTRPNFNPKNYGLRKGQSGLTVIPFADAITLKNLRQELASYIDAMPEYVSEGKKVAQKTNPYEPDPTQFKTLTINNPSTFANDEFYPVEGGFALLQILLLFTIFCTKT